ncbi:MAG: prephenate dehydrogenase/arogenate dehydrogenase family protein, partial [Sphingomonadaceae bacterium]|nr:prephenate dehydrogenase/arogenate dehydrogenase family protein [Sphingomonadaceae bacterium]
MSFSTIAIIGLGLEGGSIGLATQAHLPKIHTTGYDLDPGARAQARERGLVHEVCETAADAVKNCDLVIFCVPPGAMG